MAKRITVTISNETYERLQKVKASLNVSNLCQETIDVAVYIEELKAKEQNMTVLIERLKMEKKKASEAWKKEGFEAGQEDALEISYEDFKTLDSTKEITEDLLDWVTDKHFRWMNQDFDGDIYLEGWLEGVLSVWEKVKKNI